MEVPAADRSAAPTSSDSEGEDVLQWLLQAWMASTVASFLAGAVFWKQCGSRLCQIKEWIGELVKGKESNPIRSLLFQSTKFESSQVAQSNNIQRSLEPKFQEAFFQEFKAKQKVEQTAPSSTGRSKRFPYKRKARPSTVSKGRAVWEVMESMANRQVVSRWLARGT